MGGIAGLFHLNASPVNEILLQEMLAVTSRRRGSDKVGSFVDGSIGMGHCQFYTTEESYYEQQPFSDELSQLCIVCNGRVDNREDLIAELTLNDKDQVITDVELILAAYKKWNSGCLNHIVGDFAFVIWDKKQQRLFCARDYAGANPLFYTLVDQTFIFGSTIEQFYQHPRLSPQLNDEYVLDFLLDSVTGPLNTPGTAIKGIKRLPPACYLWVNQGRVSAPVEYWTPADIKDIHFSNPMDYAEGFREVFRGVVKSHIRNKEPVASELSGGLDSSSIVSMAANLYESAEIPNNGFIALSKNFNTYPEADEAEYQRVVIEKYNLISRSLLADNAIGMKNAESWLYPDEPYGVYCSYNEQCLTPGAANDFGATVLLTGTGGDEILCGNPLYLADLLWCGKLRTFWADLKRWSRMENMSYLHVLTELGIKPRIPHSLRPFLSVLLRKPIEFWYTFDQDSGPIVPEWIDKRFAENMGATKRIRTLVSDQNCQKASMIPEYRSLHGSNASQGAQLITCPLKVEIRQPFYDKRLVEYVMGVPMPYRINVNEEGGVTEKLLIRNGMKGILPDSIRTRTRDPEFGRHSLAGMRVDISDFLLQLDKDNVEVVKRGYVDGKIFRELLSQWMFGYWGEALGCLVNTLSLETWLKRHKSKYDA